MSFDSRQWIRLEHDGTPIWVRPDQPDWFVPNRSGDAVLRRLASGRESGGDLAERRFLARLPGDPPREYEGRHRHLQTDHLRELWFHVTDRCNMSCRHCLVSSSPQSERKLPAARILETAGQASRLGCGIFALTGGEPFVHEEFEVIVDGLLALPDAQVVVLTNGSLFRRYEAMLDRWPRERFHLQVSVDGMRDSHDRLRGEHSFDSLVEGLRRLNARGIPFTVSMCVMEHNMAEMPDVVELAADVGAANVHFLWHFVRGRGATEMAAPSGGLFGRLRQAARRASRRAITIDNVEALKSRVFSPSGTIHDGSNAGWESLALGPDGRLYPSPALVGVAGLATPLNGDLARAWRDSPALDRLRRSTVSGLASPLRFLVGGDDGDHSFVHSGEFVGGDPYLPLQETLALWLIADEASEQPQDGPPALRLKMGEVLAGCGETGEIALTHSGCLLAVASGDEVRAVQEYYTEAATSPSEEIRNPVCYPETWTAHIPDACLVRSYGCGSPVLDAEIQPGERVLDLGSGTGVECLIASKLVGRDGSVVGVDMLEPMIALARKGAAAAGTKLGFHNVEFRQAYLESLPLESGSADVVLSNCVLNLSHHKRRTFAEIFRVLADGGRLVVSDVVCETEPSTLIRNDQELRGQCIAGALTQRNLVGLLQETGFVSLRVLKRFPYRKVQGHPFYSLTFQAAKPSAVRERRVLYRGPFAAVLTDDGKVLTPGATCTLTSPAGPGESERLFELDADGRVTSEDLGTSACCSPAVASTPESSACCTPDTEASRQPSSCCGAVEGRSAKTAPKHRQGCMKCGARLEYTAEERSVQCAFCGKDFRSTVQCAGGHFVCDSCHAEDALTEIERGCLASTETNMVTLLHEIRGHGSFPLHGPEHHALVPGVILATYRNLGGTLSDDRIRLGIRRGRTVSGGACGLMGACGAAVGVGIAFGVILDASPLKAEERSTVMAVTSAVLDEIAALPAARCCLRECVVALRKAAELSRKLLPVALQAGDARSCAQFELNDECAGPVCPLFPAA